MEGVDTQSWLRGNASAHRMITEVPVAPGFFHWQHLAGGLCGSLLFCAGVVLSEEKGSVSLLELQYLLQIASCGHHYSGMTT